jgi:hypothetical protein
MKLELEISGGFAPAVTSSRYAVDVASLPEDVQKQVEELVKDLLAAPRSNTNQQLRDAMSYQLTITSDADKVSVVADDGGLSQPMRELIKLIKSVGSRTKLWR